MAQMTNNVKQEQSFPTLARQCALSCGLALLVFLPNMLMLLLRWPLGLTGTGIGSPSGSLFFSYEAVPVVMVPVVVCFLPLMMSKLLRDRQLGTRWRAACLLVLVLLLLSAFLLWQTPLILSPGRQLFFSYYHSVVTPFLPFSIYPCFFGALTSAFLCEQRSEPGIRRERGDWLFALLSVPSALAGLAFCWLLIRPTLILNRTLYVNSPSSFVLAVSAWPTLLAFSLLGGALGVCLYRWFQRAFHQPETSDGQASHSEQGGSLVDAMRTHWSGICWGYLWRLGLAGLVSLTITSLLLHTRISINVYTSLPPFINTETFTGSGTWLLPPFFAPFLYWLPFPVFSLLFLPLLMAFPGVLTERFLWRARAIWLALGTVLIFLCAGLGAKELALGLLSLLNALWYVGPGAALVYCATTLCETSTLAFLAALALGHVHPYIKNQRNRLLWLLIGVVSFSGGLIPLVIALQQFTFPSEKGPSYFVLSLDLPSIGLTLASGVLLSVSAAFFGGLLRTWLLRRLLQSDPETQHS